MPEQPMVQGSYAVCKKGVSGSVVVGRSFCSVWRGLAYQNLAVSEG